MSDDLNKALQDLKNALILEFKIEQIMNFINNKIIKIHLFIKTYKSKICQKGNKN